jgi:hypothetical protein
MFNAMGSIVPCSFSLCYREEDYVMGDACSKPSVTIRFHDLHSSDIRRVVAEIVSYQDRD